jgi:tRNA-dihydrouridine synthase C
MQDVTDLPFMRIVARRGAPDVFVTEYFRVHQDSNLDSQILRSITQNQTGVPVVAQMIGQDIPALVRSATELQQHPVAGIDLNLGCPAPIVCRKEAGGGLLRHPERVDAILGALRDAVNGRFTVKCRVGYESPAEFDQLLAIFSKHAIDALTIHGRTVVEGYRTPVHPAPIAAAVAALPCPVFANGNVVDVTTGLAYLEKTGAAGLMIGRGAIRNPWIFAQFVSQFTGTTPFQPTHRHLLAYIEELWEETMEFARREITPTKQVSRLKKFLCYISQGVDEEGRFEFEIRRAADPEDFWRICRSWLDHDGILPTRPPEKSKLFCGFQSLVTDTGG